MALLGEDFDGHLWIYGANLENQAPSFQEKFRELLEADRRDRHVRRARTTTPELREADGGDRLGVVPSIWWETGPLVVLEAFQTAGR